MDVNFRGGQIKVYDSNYVGCRFAGVIVTHKCLNGVGEQSSWHASW
jgi:hypothetical protein